jgi:hypothetical protein
MDWISLVAGSFIGVVAKELVDIWKGRLVHRRDLQRRYFDAKLEHTLAAVTFLKSASAVVRSMGKDLARLVSTAEPISGASLSVAEIYQFVAFSTDLIGINSNAKEKLEVLVKDELKAQAALGFFYGSRWRTVSDAIEQKLDTINDVGRSVVSAFERFNAVAAACANEHEIRPELSSCIKELRAALAKLANLSTQLDEVSDAAVKLMASDFDRIAF